MLRCLRCGRCRQPLRACAQVRASPTSRRCGWLTLPLLLMLLQLMLLLLLPLLLLLLRREQEQRHTNGLEYLKNYFGQLARGGGEHFFTRTCTHPCARTHTHALIILTTQPHTCAHTLSLSLSLSLCCVCPFLSTSSAKLKSWHLFLRSKNPGAAFSARTISLSLSFSPFLSLTKKTCALRDEPNGTSSVHFYFLRTPRNLNLRFFISWREKNANDKNST